MERRNVGSEQVIKWKKTGGGSLRFNGRIIKPGQIFKAKASEISPNFRDVVIPLETIPGDVVVPTIPDPAIKAVEVEYKLKSRGSGGWFDVIDKNGKALNEKALKKDIAEKLIKDLAG